MTASSALIRNREQTHRKRFPWPAAFGILACCISLASAQQAVVAAWKHGGSAYAALADAPGATRARTNPFEGNAREAMAGGKLFEQHCAECHGEKAGGTKRGPSLLQPEVRHAAPGALFWILTNGVVRQGMPVWSKLPEPERWQIVTFLKMLGPHSTEPVDQAAHE